MSESNPPVKSKFDRSRGKGIKPPHLSRPGAVAPEPAKPAKPQETGYALGMGEHRPALARKRDA